MNLKYLFIAVARVEGPKNEAHSACHRGSLPLRECSYSEHNQEGRRKRNCVEWFTMSEERHPAWRARAALRRRSRCAPDASSIVQDPLTGNSLRKISYEGVEVISGLRSYALGCGWSECHTAYLATFTIVNNTEYPLVIDGTTFTSTLPVLSKKDIRKWWGKKSKSRRFCHELCHCTAWTISQDRRMDGGKRKYEQRHKVAESHACCCSSASVFD